MQYLEFNSRNEALLRAITAPHLEVRAVEQYIRLAVGGARTPALEATRTIQHRGRIYVLVRRSDGEILAIYLEKPGGRLKSLRRPSDLLRQWVSRTFPARR